MGQKTKETGTRELALEWWNNLEDKDGVQDLIDLQLDLCIKYNSSLNLHGRLPSSLTGREIEEIWAKEKWNQIVQNSIDVDDWSKDEVKPNHKTYTEFNEELATKFINKFNNEGKKRFYNLAFKLIDWEEQ